MRSSSHLRERELERSRQVPSGLEELVTAVRAIVSLRADWRETAGLVARKLSQHLPAADVLSPEQRLGDRDGYSSHLLYSEPGGAFSIVALVWCPGQVTPVHDHVTWCVFGVIEGEEHEELFLLDEERGYLVAAGEPRRTDAAR